MSNAKAPRVIVVGTDFSADSDAALAWATKIAREHGAGIIMVHALSSGVLPTPEFVPVPPEYVASVHGEAKELLEKAAARSRAEGVDVECELLLSWPSIGILDIAERFSADLIVLGTRGRSSWKRALLGSTAARVVRQAPCPVLTVHHGAAGQPRPVRTVLVPTDFSRDADAAVDAASVLLGGGPNRRLILAHAYRIPIEAAHLPAQVLSDAIRATEIAASEGLHKIAKRLHRPGLTIDLASRDGDPTDVILDLAKTDPVDVIAMGTRGRSGLARMLLGSTAERVLSSASCPVLTVHEPLAR